GQGEGDEVPRVFRNKARGVECTWTEEGAPRPLPTSPALATAARLGGAECRLAWTDLRGSVPLDRLPQPARPHLDQQICRPGLKTREKPGKGSRLRAESRRRFVRAAGGLRVSGPAPSPSRPPRLLLPSSADPVFSASLSFPPPQSPLSSFPFCHLHSCPPAPHHHDPLTGHHHDFHHHRHPEDWPTLPRQADSSGEFPRGKAERPSPERLAAFVEIKTDA
ncbi:unnamed protein product, partial [Rangifer tarandus platyrhynchus]